MADSRITDLTELTTPAVDDWLEVVDKSNTTDNAAGSSRKIALTRVGGLVLQTTAKTAGFTAVNGESYLVDLATAAAHVTVTMPASPSVGDRFRVTVRDDDLSSGYRIEWARNSSNIMSGTDDDPYWLFIEGESIEWRYIGGGSGWIMDRDGRIPMVGRMRQTTTGNSLNNGSFTKLTNWVSQKDVGGIVDTTNSRFNVRRSNEYLIGGRVTSDNLGADKILIMGFFDDSGNELERLHRATISTADNPTMSSAINMSVTAGSPLTLQMFVNEAGRTSDVDPVQVEGLFWIREFFSK